MHLLTQATQDAMLGVVSNYYARDKSVLLLCKEAKLFIFLTFFSRSVSNISSLKKKKQEMSFF